MHDLLFKETFANKSNRRQLEKLLEDFLDYPKGCLHNKLKVTYETPIKKNHNRQKSVRGDIIVQYGDTTINIEVYREFDKESIDKSLYYVMRIEANQLEVGDEYYKLGKTIQINFVENSKLGLGDEFIYNFYIACDENPKIKLLEEQFCVKIVQIDKARENGYTLGEIDKWVKFIVAGSYEERKEIAKGDELLMELNDWIKKYVADEETQEKLNKWDLQIAKNKGYNQGVEDGIEQGVMQRNTEIAKNLFKMNMSLEDISKATGLTREEIERLKENK